ncbi:T9SS type B sorting domain-containing protein [Polaribacter aestuariivivens]|uniref:T9SS type B sorting domain-containing protein n=1 Tax=Polaribacter aestuariivivens TaxID=2304626 RepID=A0A5S3N0R0_9FLAO|nr:T9SS type B sorting domain-containing protein [Polaribacter aestuariivivens]TMM28878.1 T9SS type B sorting domain-containing protein [Polaribacter aestuariivivens]
MKQKVVGILFILIANLSFSQGEANFWFFGEKAGIDFDLGRTNILSNSQITAPAGSASISDRNGNLLFYTNGETIWNKNHQIMENGTGLAGEIGNTQTAVIVPKPGSQEIYYVFTTRMESDANFSAGLKYSEVEISNAFPLGKVISKNVFLAIYKTERITAVHSDDGNAIWVITFGSSNSENTSAFETFSIFKVDATGVDNRRTMYRVPEATTTSSIGQLKIAPDGKTIGLANFDFTGKEALYILDFDTSTGEVTYRNKISTNMGPNVFIVPYGIAFSQDSKIIYFSGDLNVGPSLVRQFNVEGSSDPLNSPIVLTSSNAYKYRSLQLGSDGKIYVAKKIHNDNDEGSEFLSVINEPNISGLDSDFVDNQENVTPGLSFSGLPNFVQSFFESRIFSEDKCLGENVNFSATSYIPIQSINWDFGDGNSATGLTPTHQYTSSGSKIVQAEITLNNNTIVNVYKKIQVFALPILKPNQELVQCDDDFDGISNFNLFNIREKITNPALDEELFFYETNIDAQADINRITTPDNYRNTIPNQEIFIKVVNENGCISFSSFRVNATFVQVDPISEMYVCEDSDSTSGNQKGAFDLQAKKVAIYNDLNLDRTTTTLRFYNTYSDALTTTNELPENFISKTTTIWVRVDENASCGGIQSFEAIVNSQPIINLQNSYTICFDPSLKPPITLSADTSNERHEWKNSLGTVISTNINFTLTNTGTFSLTSYKTENNIECSFTKEFEVTNPENPVFSNIIVNTEDENNNIVEVFIDGNSTYEFSLDNTTFFGNTTSYTFTQVIPGLKTIYVRDTNNCETPIQQNVSVLGVQEYFTPNGDGVNDFWNIRGLDAVFYKSINIKIFDRLGRIVGSITDFNSPGWDGTFNGKTLISNNYWFTVEIVDIDDNLIKKTGNFSLIRK